MQELNKNLANLPIKKCKHRGCKKKGVAFCIFANGVKGEPPIWMGYLCEEHHDLYHRKYTNGQWS